MESDYGVMDGNRTEPNHLVTPCLHVREQSLSFRPVTAVADLHGQKNLKDFLRREKSYVDSRLRGDQTKIRAVLYCSNTLASSSSSSVESSTLATGSRETVTATLLY